MDILLFLSKKCNNNYVHSISALSTISVFDTCMITPFYQGSYEFLSTFRSDIGLSRPQRLYYGNGWRFKVCLCMLSLYHIVPWTLYWINHLCLSINVLFLCTLSRWNQLRVRKDKPSLYKYLIQLKASLSVQSLCFNTQFVPLLYFVFLDILHIQ